MNLHNEPNVKQEHRLLKIVIVSTCIAGVLGAIFFFAGNFLPSTKSLADEGCDENGPNIYTVSGNTSSNSNEDKFDDADDGDTIKITQTLTVNNTCNEMRYTDVVVLVDGGQLYWYGAYSFHIGSNGKVLLKNGGTLTCRSGQCSKYPALRFNNTKVVSCNGQEASYSFSEVNAAGGVKSSGLTALPVTLVRFETILNNQEVIVKWATASEINNSHFDIERSNDNKNWKVVGTMKGNGNSNSLINYTFTDYPGIFTAPIYYRLHQIDFDGKNEYGPVSVVSSLKKEKLGKVYPNPANDVIKISLNSNSYQLSIQDQSGKIILLKQVYTDFETIDCKEFPNGVYFIKLENETTSENHKIVVKH
jgi:hypothetical protein